MDLCNVAHRAPSKCNIFFWFGFNNCIMLKNDQTFLKILCSHHKIFKVCLAIFQRKRVNLCIKALISRIWGKIFKSGPSKVCGRQRLNNMKWYGLLRQTILLEIFQSLSSTNFTWSILKFFAPFKHALHHFLSIYHIY